MEELEELLQLLALERKADLEFYKAKVQSQPLEKRRKEGFTWFPLTVVRVGSFYGDRVFVVVERTAQLDEPHQFRSGATVNLFSKAPDAYKPERSGVIQDLNKNSMRIILNSNDLPDWLNSGQLGVDLLFDDRTYVEMERAVKQVAKAERDRLAELRDILLGHRQPSFRAVQTPPPSINAQNQLNESQLAAIRQINNAYDVAVIHGPPGTGKTTTVVHAVVEVCKYERQVLVAAPSNTAADLLTERLAEQGLQVVRIGNISRVDETLLKHTLEGQISTHPESKNIKKLRIKAAELRNLARTFKRRMDYEARSRRQQLKDEARELAAWATNLEERMIQQILDGAQVITSTLVGSSHPVLHNLKFRTVFIDEAAQGLEPATWIPILKATRVVFAGDPFQLPPTVKSIEAAKRGLQITQIEKCIQRFHNVNLLNVQYRMHKNIMNFSNAVFYDNQLIAHESVENKKLHFYENEEAVTFVDTAGCGFDEKVNPESLSRFNAEEFFILREHLYQLVEKFDSSVDFPLPSIGIVSPYREQVEFMETQILEDPILADFLKKKRISISTIDGFQGQERDVMYISLVRSNPKFEIGFLSDTRRMNVAMTRARMKLIVVGDSSTIGNHHFYKAFLDYAEKNGAYRTAWEFMAT